MAYPPQPATLATAGGPSTFDRYSASPPVNAPISKRDKKRLHQEDRFHQYGAALNENREPLYRTKHQEYQADLAFIQSANLYDNKPLEEPDYDGLEDFLESAAASTHGSLRHIPHAQTNGKSSPWLAGKHSFGFVYDVNNSMEERDVGLITLAYHHNYRIEEITKEHDYYVGIANQEHQRLCEQLRSRLIQQVNQRKLALLKEKERLDVGDTSVHIFAPTQFGSTNGASPGGPHSQRKTRHARARYENEDPDIVGVNNKRKRRALADGENGSPAPAGHEVEPTIPREAYDKLEAHQSSAPFYSVERLFSERELNENIKGASYDVLENMRMEMMKRRKSNLDAQINIPSALTINDDASDAEEAVIGDNSFGNDGAIDDPFLLAAPDMARTTTNTSYHATRSTRVLNLNNGVSVGESLGELAGRYAMIERIGTYPKVEPKEKKREEEYNRAAPSTDLEAETDIILMRQAMLDEDAGREVHKKLLYEVVEERPDHIGGGDARIPQAKDRTGREEA